MHWPRLPRAIGRARSRAVTVRKASCSGALLTLLGAAPVLAAPISPAGGVLAVSTPGPPATKPGVAVSPDGAFTVVWQAYTSVTDEWDIYQRRFDAAGVPLAAAQRVNATVAGCQVAPAVTSDGTGRRVIAWESGGRVVFRRFDADGTALDPSDIEADAAATGSQRRPAIAAAAADGSFALSWQGRGAAGDANSWGVYARVFAATGVPVAATALLNQGTSGAQHSPAVTHAVGSPSVFAVAWQSQGQDGSGAGVFWRRLDTAGTPLGGEQLVGNVVSGSQRSPRLAADASGNVVILWENHAPNETVEVAMRRFRASGTAIGNQLTTSISSTPSGPAVASAAGGDFLAAWALSGTDGGLALVHRGFDHRSMPFEVEQLAAAGLARARGAAAARGGNQLVLAWPSGAVGQPPSVVAQRFIVSGLDFYTVAPCRMVDTRNPPGPLGGPQLSGGVSRAFTLAGATCGIPGTARALSINITAIPSSLQGNIKLFAGDAPDPGTSSINFTPGLNRANNAILLLSRDGLGTLVALASVNVDMVVDVNGYFE